MKVRFVNIGKSVTQQYQGRVERTAFRKRPVEEAACVGDVYQIGEAEVQVLQPRGPCYKIDMVYGRGSHARACPRYWL